MQIEEVTYYSVSKLRAVHGGVPHIASVRGGVSTPFTPP